MVTRGARAGADQVRRRSLIAHGVIEDLIALYESSGQAALASRYRQELEEGALP